MTRVDKKKSLKILLEIEVLETFINDYLKEVYDFEVNWVAHTDALKIEILEFSDGDELDVYSFETEWGE